MTQYLYAFLLFCFVISCRSNPKNDASVLQVASGTIERLENFPSQFVPPRHIDIWLPEGYKTDEKYAVLYMHDGQMLFDTSSTWNHQEWGVDETFGKLIKTKQIKKCIVVGIWNAGKNRHAEYFPQKVFESLPQSFQDSLLQSGKRSDNTSLFSRKVYSDNYLKFLSQELKPFIDKKYATHKDRAHTFIAGSSMGGLISMYAICEYPSIFGGAACLSTHWIGTFTNKNNPIPAAFAHYLNKNLPDPTNHKLYFDYGTETLDALYEEAQLQVDSILKTKKYITDNQLLSKKFTGADHSERSWQKRLEIPVRFLLAL